MQTHTFLRFMVMAILVARTSYASHYIKTAQSHPKTTASCLVATIVGGYGIYKFIRTYTAQQSQHHLKDYQDFYDTLAKKYAHCAYTEDELEKLCINDCFQSTIEEYYQQVQTDRSQLETQCAEMEHQFSPEKMDQNLLNRANNLVRQLKTLEIVVAQAVKPIELRALIAQYTRKFSCIIGTSNGKLHTCICEQFRNKEFPYPYVLCYDALEAAIKALDTLEKKVDPSHKILKESQELKINLIESCKHIGSLPTYHAQEIEFDQSKRDSLKYSTLKKQRQATEQLTKEFAAINEKLEQLLMCHAEELPLFQQLVRQQIELFKVVIPTPNAPSAPNKLLQAIQTQLPQIQAVLEHISTQQKEINLVKALQETHYQNNYTALASLQEQINTLKNNKQNSTLIQAPLIPSAPLENINEIQNQQEYPQLHITQPGEL